MTTTRVLVTGATGKIGGAVAAQLLEKGVPTRALVHRDDARSARLRALGAETVVADIFDIQQVQAAVDGVDRLFFNPRTTHTHSTVRSPSPWPPGARVCRPWWRWGSGCPVPNTLR